MQMQLNLEPNRNFIMVAVLIIYFLTLTLDISYGRDVEFSHYPPCYFNPLCTCSKSVPDLGIVRCQNTRLGRIPGAVNVSKVFMLHLENNSLRSLEPHFLQNTGLYKITISKNPLYIIHENAFTGLERSLWELDLSNNMLAEVPSRALRHLQRLTLLNLSGNEILQVNSINWRGLEHTLKTLILSDNSISSLRADSFSDLPVLEIMDLHGNNLREIDPSVFRSGMNRLSQLILSDNQLVTIPYQAVFPLKLLKILDLGFNVINTMQPPLDSDGQMAILSSQLSLDILNLQYNKLTSLETMDFQYFDIINKTIMDGNALSEVKANAFRQAKIRELYLRNCRLNEISPEAFNGLENYLQILDLSANHFAELPEEPLENLQILETLQLRDNPLKNLNDNSLLSRFKITLGKLDISGKEMGIMNPKELTQFHNLRVLSFSKQKDTSLEPDTFTEYGTELEELEVTFSKTKIIKNHAFKYIHGLKKLHLAENSIDTIENDAFLDIGHSLKSLRICNSLGSSFQIIPTEAFKHLTSLQELDFSNNKIKIIPENSFHFLSSLRHLYLHDNVIDAIPKGTFQGDIHQQLSDVSLSFNNLKVIKQHTFVDLNNLKRIHLDDNSITQLERRSFMNLENLEQLDIKGNKIATVSYETFQNLPQLEDLDLSYNKLSALDFSMFDQVGTLATFKVNFSHNDLQNLVNLVQADGLSNLHSNIKILDLSHNNISTISQHFFKPVELSLTHMYMQYNKLLNASKGIFGNMPHLQVLDISHNGMYEIEFDTFRNSKKLQFLFASHNHLAEVPNDLFKDINYLRIVDFSNNRLRQLPDNFFKEGILEVLDLSHNFLSKLPLTSFSTVVAASICELDLAWNSISSVVHGGLLSRFKSLTTLNLSYNRLAQIDAGTFKDLSHLLSLDLSHNNQLTLEPNGLSFNGVQDSLLQLNLNNVSLVSVPYMPASHLIELSLAYNSLPTIPPEIAPNLTLLRSLDISNNDLTSVPIVTHSLPELRHLFMANNPIGMITNTSLLGLAKHLIELDMRNLDLTSFEAGAFCKMYVLRILKFNFYENIKNYNIPKYLGYNNGLQNLEIHITTETNSIDDEMVGIFPSKLRSLTFSGKGLQKFSSNALRGILSPTLHVRFQNTSLAKVSSTVFRNMENVQNLTIDIRHNALLKSFHNPSTGVKPNLPGKVFLQSMAFHGNHWKCDCDIGWAEVWQRKLRQYVCIRSNRNALTQNLNENCGRFDDDIRNVFCENKQNKSLIEVLKSDIECGWSSTISRYQVQFSYIILIPTFTFIL